MPAQSSSMVASFGRYLSRAREQRKLLFTSTTFQWLSGKCPSLVSDENTGRPTYRPRGGWDEGSTLGAAFSAYETKRQLCMSRAFWFSSRIWQRRVVT